MSAYVDKSPAHDAMGEFQERLSEKSELLLHMLTQAYWMAYTSGKADTPAARDWKATLDYIKEPLK